MRFSYCHLQVQLTSFLMQLWEPASIVMTVGTSHYYTESVRMRA